MKICLICKKERLFLSNVLKICLDCIRERPKLAQPFIERAHQKTRKEFIFPPKNREGIKCNLCANECQIKEGERGYCGLRKNINKKLESEVNEEISLLYSYFDQIPTNCCASWFCPPSNEAITKNNLAVFFYGCSFDCLFCQNYSHKLIEGVHPVKTDELLERALDTSVCCLCFFGGSCEPQLPFAINFSQKLLKKKKIRICFEWNGSGNKDLVKKVAEISLESGGIIKFDLKAFTENLSYALSGVSNKRSFENFEMIAKEFLPKTKNQMLTATTLLVPGYVDKVEVEEISKFIAFLNPEIPYSLLVFYPAFYMIDLPITPKEWAFECLSIAKKYLKNVNLGNIHLLNL